MSADGQTSLGEFPITTALFSSVTSRTPWHFESGSTKLILLAATVSRHRFPHSEQYLTSSVVLFLDSSSSLVIPHLPCCQEYRLPAYRVTSIGR
jgi:hypothetical protein